tara:strand:+ start:7663 stop:7851 length:189 start_codon:yes stop_codon:yes gene_type:complete
MNDFPNKNIDEVNNQLSRIKIRLEELIKLSIKDGNTDFERGYRIGLKDAIRQIKDIDKGCAK